MKLHYGLIILFYSYSCFTQAQNNCNQAVIRKELGQRLNPAICISEGFVVTDVFETDLNGDHLRDQIIESRKSKLVDGDTIIYSIYLQRADSSFQQPRIFKNFKPLFFYNYSDEYLTGTKKLDSVKIRYINPELNQVTFEDHTIILKIYVESVIFKNLFFKYSVEADTWNLAREQRWLFYKKAEENLEYEIVEKIEYDGPPARSLDIKNFDVLRYTGW